MVQLRFLMKYQTEVPTKDNSTIQQIQGIGYCEMLNEWVGKDYQFNL